MVAVGRRHEGNAAQTLTVLRFLERLVRHLTLRQIEVLRKVACDGVARPQPFECIQPEPLALVLHCNPPETETCRKAFEIGKRCRLVHGQTPMERNGTRCRPRTERGDVREFAVRMGEMHSLDTFVHITLPLNLPWSSVDFLHYSTVHLHL